MDDRVRPFPAGAAAVTDPITVELVRGAMRSIQNEMEALIERTAMSAFIREKKDFYAGLFDAGGRFLAGKSRPGGSLVKMAAMISFFDSPKKGSLPVSIWYNTTPKLQMSQRGSMSRPRACSGDI